jgi:hypothetical protein
MVQNILREDQQFGVPPNDVQKQYIHLHDFGSIADLLNLCYHQSK